MKYHNIKIDDEVFAYLQKHARPFIETTPNMTLRRLFRLDKSRPGPKPPPPTDSPVGFVFHGKRYPCRSAREVMTSLFELLNQQDTSFFERFASRKHGKKRRLIARDKYDLYQDRIDLCKNYSYEFSNGWFM